MAIFDFLIAATIVYFAYRVKKRKSNLPLPPGPKGVPFFGNAFSIPAEYPWITYHQWSQELETDIIHLNMMGQSVIVLDKMQSVSDLLEKRSALYSSRPWSTFMHSMVGATFHFGFLPYGETWRQHRRLTSWYVAPNMADNYHPCVMQATRNLMARLLDGPVTQDLKVEFRAMAGDSILNLCYGIDIRSEESPYYIGAVERGIRTILEAAIPGQFFVDFMPILRFVPEWFPGAAFQKKARQYRHDVQEMINVPFKAVKQNVSAGTCPSCYCCTTLQALESRHDVDFDIDDAVKRSAGALYAAGADTTSTTLASCILGLLGRPDVIRRARCDLDRVIQPGRMPDLNDQADLPYITAIAKEALRWRDVTPLGLPHFLDSDDIYRGYRIPGGSVILVNQWAMLHDDEDYPDPFEFKPERFMDGDQFNYETKDPETACFGFGRRVCVGRYMAFSSIWITIASLLYAFDIEKEIDEDGCIVEPNPHYSSDLAYSPEKVVCRVKPRSEEFAKLVQSVANGHELTWTDV